MKLVTVIVKPFAFGEIHASLDRLGVAGMTATEVLGYGRQCGRTEVYRGAEVATEFVDAICDAVITAAHTGDVGDGKLWVTDVERVVRVRTGEAGDSAV